MPQPLRRSILWQGPGFQREPIPWFFFSHLPSQRPEKFASDNKLDHGRFLFEELACIKCHQPAKDDAVAKTLVERTGPDLTKIGSRAFPGWLDAWLADPAKLRPQTTMPKMFADTEQGKAERYAVVQYLTSHGGPLKEAKFPRGEGGYIESLSRGQKLFTTAGCAACHGPKLAGTMKRNEDDNEPPPFDPLDSFYGLGSNPQSRYALGGIGSKTTPDELAKYLRDPMKTNPHGRMPAMGLSDGEARDIARHLMRYTEESIESRTKVAEPKWKASRLADDVLGKTQEWHAFMLSGAAGQWEWLGKKLFVTKGCVNCHAMNEEGKPLTAKSDFASLARIRRASDEGCLGEKPTSVHYTLDDKQRDALRQFVKGTASSVGTDSPTYQTRAALKRFNCLNCHLKENEGGIGSELADAMKKLENAQNADDVQPPRLTGIGHKATTAWLKDVLVNGGRARPWMTLRMPQYGEANVGLLVTGLAACEGLPPDTATPKPKITSSQIEQGRKLAGKEGLGCVACHDISGYVGGGTRGPDLATTDRRVRLEWYGRWMHNPQRLAPGTRMPSNFTEGRSVSNLLGGDAEKQTAALWAYFTLGPGLPLPAGLEPPSKGMPLAVKDRPEILRTFMPDNAGTRPIAVGFPGSAGSYCFDSHAARLAYAWEGNFLDVQPVWDQRGGNPARLLGQKYFTAPPGQPWAVTDGEMPDFAKRASNCAYGAVMPFHEFFKGPMRVHFDGYSLDTVGKPTFRYSVDSSDGQASVSVAETPVPLRAAIASGLQRSFVIDRPAGKTLWLLVAATEKESRTVNGVLWLPQPNDRALAVKVATLPEGTKWEFLNDGKLAVLKIPPVKSATKSELGFTIWSMPRTIPRAAPELIAGFKITHCEAVSFKLRFLSRVPLVADHSARPLC